MYIFKIDILIYYVNNIFKTFMLITWMPNYKKKNSFYT